MFGAKKKKVNYEVIPFKSVGSLKFGMKGSEVRKSLRTMPTLVHNKTEYPQFPTELYKTPYVFVFYDSKGEAEAFEFPREQSIYFDGQDLFSLSKDELVSFLEKHDPHPIINSLGDGMDFNNIGISLYIPLKDNVEAILIFKKGYFDDFYKENM